MFGFGNKKKEKSQKVKPRNDDMHLLFRIAALVVVILIVYKVYVSEERSANIADDMSVENFDPDITEKKIEENIKKAFEEMYNSPKFKRIKLFVDYIHLNRSDKEPKLLNAEDGYIIYLPKNVVEGNLAGELLEVKGEDININMELEKPNGNQGGKEEQK